MTTAYQQHCYTQAYRHWCQETHRQGIYLALTDPVYNNHREFHAWLHEQYGIQARLQNLVINLRFPDAATETWWALRYS